MGQGPSPDAGPLDLALAQVIANEARQREWVQFDLVRESGVSHSRLKKTVYYPTKSMHLSELESIARCMGVSPAALVRRAEESLGRPTLRIAAKPDGGNPGTVDDEFRES